MYICRILLIQLIGCHIEINACLVGLEESRPISYLKVCVLLRGWPLHLRSTKVVLDARMLNR